jgi:cephalosporin hydroxylase
MMKRIRLVEGSSTDALVLSRVKAMLGDVENVLVILDSLHTHEHVLRELELYSPFVRKGGYLVVCDTVIEDLPKGHFSDRPWDKGDNPMTAVEEFLKENHRFEVDRGLSDKLILTSNPGGYLRCIAD